jgi:hypothetical protein
MACGSSGLLLPTKSEIIKAGESAGATHIVINSYMYATRSWDNPSINTDGGYRRTDLWNVQVRVSYSGSISNTAVENAIRQLFINNSFSSSDITVFANTTSLPQQPGEVERRALPVHQAIIETVQNFGATGVTIATYTASGSNVPAAGSTVSVNAAIVIRVNYSFNGLGVVIPSQAAVTLAIRNLFTDFTHVTASVSPTAMFPLPSHSSVRTIAGEQGASNIRVLEYTANNGAIGEFYYGSRPSNTPIRISITYDVGANVTFVEQAVRGLFQHFTSVTVSTMLALPTREEIISELNKAGAASIDIIAYTVGGSNAGEGLRAINAAIRLEVRYTTTSATSNGQAAVRSLFAGFTHAHIFVGNNIPISLPTQTQILNAVYGNTYDIGTANINTYTVNGMNASSLSVAESFDAIIIRIRASTWVSTGFNWGQGYWQAIGNNSTVANNARSRVIQLFIDAGFSTTRINVIFE